ncbi:MAG TPA: hypothetical protein VFE33_10010 [Thermoanaerobaculia bacterium]|nr:hypothetical protein [Thermoanaerobaculia bacterium]
MAHAVVHRFGSPVTERIFPDPDLLTALDEEPPPRQARVLCFPESAPEGSPWRWPEREEAVSR